VPYQTGPPQQADIEGAGKEERYTWERYSYNKVEKVTIYGREEVSIDDEDKESMDEGNNIRYLRMN
jgi:hypothetical protein